MATSTSSRSGTRRKSGQARVTHQGHDMSLIIMRISMGLLGLGSLLQASGFHTAGGLLTAAGGACGVGSK